MNTESSGRYVMIRGRRSAKQARALSTKWPYHRAESTYLSGLESCLASARCSRLVRRGRLGHRAESVMRVADELENLSLQLSPVIHLDLRREFQRMLKHLDAITISESPSRIFGRQYEIASS